MSILVVWRAETMQIRNSVPGDKLVLVEHQGRRLLQPESEEDIEVRVGNGAVTEIYYISKEWDRYGHGFFGQILIPRTFLRVEEAIFFYPKKDGIPEVWMNLGKKRIPLSKLKPGTKFKVTRSRRAFKSVHEMIFWNVWVLADEPPDFDDGLTLPKL